MFRNPLTAIDFYKADHRRQYPVGTTKVYSNFTPRSNHLSNLPNENNQIVFFGLQYFIKSFLMDSWNENFFNLPKDTVVNLYKRRMDTSLGKDAVPVEHIAELHDLGYLPLEIRALPEGSLVNIKVPCLTITNTKSEFFWLVNYLESAMSCYLWKPCVSASTARWYRRTLDKFAEETGGDMNFVQFQGHDFSFRGMSGPEDAALSGAAHLTSFVGTDTVPAIDLLEHYYEANADEELVGCSVPATEHSVMCMGGKEDEIGTFKRLVTELYPSGIVSVVSDTWDFWKVVTEYVNVLKPEIMARAGKVVIRPDSGDPVKIICGEDIKTADTIEDAKADAQDDAWEDAAGDHGEHGASEVEYLYQIGDKFYRIVVDIEWNRYDKQFYYQDGRSIRSCEEITPSPAELGAIRCLWNVFGGTTNAKGFKELDSHIGLIYGDSITPVRAHNILSQLKKMGFASTNIVFGIGSFTYQYCTRDTYGFAMKATYGEVNGVGRAIFKDPITDSGTKKSAKGLLVVKDGALFDEQTDVDQGDLKVVYRDGELLKEWTLSEIRNNVKGS